MKRSRLTILFHLVLWVIGIGSVVWGDTLHYIESKQKQLPESKIASLIPGSNKIEAKSSPLPHYDVFDSGGKLSGVVFITSKVPPKVNGYGGEIPTAVGIDTKGKITGLLPLENNETPSYFNRLKETGFFQKLKGKSVVSDELEEVDVVTGATISSDALKTDIKLSGRRIALKVLGINIPQEKVEEGFAKSSSTHSSPLNIAIAIVAILLASAASFTAKPWLKWVSLAVGFAGIGWYLNSSVSFVVISNLLGLNLAIASNIVLVVLLIFTVGMALAGRRTWCNFMCPFGAAQEAIYAVSPVRLKLNPSPRLMKHTWNTRYILLVALLVAIFVFDVDEAAEIEPYTRMFNLSSPAIFWYYTAFLLGMSAFVPRFFCRFLCPTGAVLTLLMQLNSRLRKFTTGKKRNANETKVS